MAKGLTTTDALWPGIRTAYDWVHHVAQILENEAAVPGSEVKRQLENLLAEMTDEQATVGVLQPAVAHFLKASASYWPGLFHCYDIAGLPRTNNDLEQYFGSARYHQRRASGRLHATAATVVRGSVRVLAATASRLTRFREYDLRHPNLERWTGLRRSLELRQDARRRQGRFRKNPAGYLATLETMLLKSSLPS
ncbi:MAG: hypothetical protein M3492_13785 [Actinomycetota bacterium]|nr:hypothetical protein [Actinomycetota bacterium]